MQIFKNPSFNFIKYRWHALFLSWTLIVAGLVSVYVWGIPLGVEFSGGTIVILQFEKTPPTIDQVRRALDRGFPGGGGGVVVQTYGQASQRQIMIRAPHTGKESGTELGQTAEQVQKAVGAANLGKFDVAGTEIVGPMVGRDLTQKGILATTLSLAGILIYIAFRFQLSFAVGAIVASVHDLLITMAFLAFFRYDLSLNVIAAILTLTGYSMNDTIVIFDRVRENLRLSRRESLYDIVNRSVNQTLSRTIITSGTTFLAVLSLFLFGGEVLHGFAFTMLIGIITGTYSSVFIAAAIAIIITEHSKGGRARNMAVPVPAAAETKTRKGGRKARAS
jgi:preprotein translocase subunit SecF